MSVNIIQDLQIASGLVWLTIAEKSWRGSQEASVDVIPDGPQLGPQNRAKNTLVFLDLSDSKSGLGLVISSGCPGAGCKVIGDNLQSRYEIIKEVESLIRCQPETKVQLSVKFGVSQLAEICNVSIKFIDQISSSPRPCHCDGSGDLSGSIAKLIVDIL